MSPLLIKISKDFATLFTTINPIATLALFAGLTASLSRADRHWTALRACIYATIILVVAMTAGQVILDAIGIHMHSLKVAGGIILFLFGSQMLFGKMDEKPGRPLFISRAVDGNCYPRTLFASLEQRKHLRIRTIRIPRAGQLATRAHVLAGPAQYRAHDRLAGIKFCAGRGIINNTQNDNLVLTIAEGKSKKRCALLQVWVDVCRELDQRLCANYHAITRSGGR